MHTRLRLKICSMCKEVKNRSEFFYTCHGRPISMCKPCKNTYGKVQYQKHITKRRAYDRARGNRWTDNDRKRWEPTPEQKHDQYLKRTYGITLERYNEIFENQGEVCAICKGECNRSTTTRLCVDHDHSTNIVRGLLCFQCNVGLGKFNDNPYLIEAALKYLKGD